jgi:hypothetical protein
MLVHGRRFKTNIRDTSTDGLTVIVLANLAQADPVGLAHGIAETVNPELMEKPIRTRTEPEMTASHRGYLKLWRPVRLSIRKRFG